MEQREFERAISAPNFIEAAESLRSAEGIDVIDIAGTSGSVLLLRFLFTSAAWMRPRHPAFEVIGKHLSDRANYLAFCVASDPAEGGVPKDMATYCLKEAQSDAFWSCKWQELDMVNATPGRHHEGGFLAVRHIQNGTIYSRVTTSDHYTVEACLLGVRDCGLEDCSQVWGSHLHQTKATLGIMLSTDSWS